MNRHAIILAAGQGTRMKSALPKVLQPLGGMPMLGHVLHAARAAGVTHQHVVLGHGADAVRDWLLHAGGDGIETATQAQQLGTAHAVLQAMPQVPDDALVVVLYGDVPLVWPATLEALGEAAADGLALVTAELPEPQGYGRILRDGAHRVIGIVEEKDASPLQRKIHEINTGLLAAPAARLRQWLSRVGNDNAKGEFYLTDVVALAVADGVAVRTVSPRSISEIEGANDRAQLAHLERRLQSARAEALMRAGVAIADPARFDLRGELVHGRDVFIDVGCVFEGRVELGDRVRIGPYCVLRDVTLAAGTTVDAHSVLEQASAGRDCRIGPFARLRPEAELQDEVHIGNFVEVKKTRIGRGSKANHLAYLGDGEVGEQVNIGAGTIFCNYDGANKHRTVIEDRVFVGSDTQLVAPVRIGEGATIGAGSTIAKDVPPGGLTLCRAREQKTYGNWKRPEKKPKQP